MEPLAKTAAGFKLAAKTYGSSITRLLEVQV
jgi:hypothetical protein